MTPISDSSWDDTLTQEEAKHFVGRQQELEVFRQEIALPSPHYFIFYITGQGGAGKTALLNVYKKIAQEDLHYLVTECDEQQKDIPEVLGHIAQQLALAHSPLKHFDKRYQTYQQKILEIKNDPEAPLEWADILGRTAAHAVFAGVKMSPLPGIREGLDFLPQDIFEAKAGELTKYLVKKFRNKDDVNLIKEPVPILTKLFFEDLNKIARKQKILLCFENFEETRQELQEWLLRLPEYKPSPNIRLAIAGREQLGMEWNKLQSIIKVISLDVFTPEEAEAFLGTYANINTERRLEILQHSYRLPVLMSLLAHVEGTEPDPSIPTGDIVERFLHRVTPPQRQVALLAAIARTFNLDVLQQLLKGNSHVIDIQSAFDWLVTMPFVRQYSHSWRYHDVVRRIMLLHLRSKSLRSYQQAHATLADFYRTEMKQSGEQQWTEERWRKDTLAYIYHSLIAHPNEHWVESMSIFALAVRKHEALAVQMIEMLNVDDVQGELSDEQNKTVQLFRQQLQAIRKEGHLEEGFAMFHQLCGIAGLSDQAKGYALTCRGECYRLNEQWEEALNDFGQALQYNPLDVWAISGRGEILLSLGRYKEALDDLDSAIALNDHYAWANNRRGVTYRLMENYRKALQDFDRSIALDPKDIQAITNRGLTYRLMGHYQEALVDYNHALAFTDQNIWTQTNRPIRQYQETLTELNRTLDLDPKNVEAITRRGVTYRLMGRYQEALKDFDHAVALNEHYAWAIANLGVTYRQVQLYKDALANLNQAIELNEHDVWAIVNRGMTYRFMGDYQKALEDFNRAITLDEKNDWYRYCRAQVYLLLGQTSAFERDLKDAIALAHDIAHSTSDDHWIGFHLALYALANGNVADAEAQYNHVAFTCSSLSHLQDAVEDLADFLTIEPFNKKAEYMLTLLQTRIAEIKLATSE